MGSGDQAVMAIEQGDRGPVRPGLEWLYPSSKDTDLDANAPARRELSRYTPILQAEVSDRCGAWARTKGRPCVAKALPRSGRCKQHGGFSTGPRTEAGKELIRKAARASWATAERMNAHIARVKGLWADPAYRLRHLTTRYKNLAEADYQVMLQGRNRYDPKMWAWIEARQRKRKKRLGELRAAVLTAQAAKAE